MSLRHVRTPSYTKKKKTQLKIWGRLMSAWEAETRGSRVEFAILSYTLSSRPISAAQQGPVSDQATISRKSCAGVWALMVLPPYHALCWFWVLSSQLYQGTHDVGQTAPWPCQLAPWRFTWPHTSQPAATGLLFIVYMRWSKGKTG